MAIHRGQRPVPGTCRDEFCKVRESESPPGSMCVHQQTQTQWPPRDGPQGIGEGGRQASLVGAPE